MKLCELTKKDDDIEIKEYMCFIIVKAETKDDAYDLLNDMFHKNQLEAYDFNIE